MTSLIKLTIFGCVSALVPALVFAGPADKKTLKVTCPDHFQDAVSALKTNISEHKWTNIVVDVCPHIQSEIINNLDTVLTSNEFELYLALMNQETIRLVRNAFFAKKGYKFEDDNLQKRFSEFKWYKPTDNNNDITLSAEEKRRVSLLKKIEEKWIISRPGDESNELPQTLPQGVVIRSGKNKTELRFKKKSFDISPRQVTGSSDTIYFKVYSNQTTGTVLLCRQKKYGQVDGGIVEKLNIFSSDGTLLHEFTNTLTKSNPENWIGGLEQCPAWIKERPNILVSYNNNGCCGATSDELATFDEELHPIAVINCGEPGCAGTSFFNELNEGNLYLSVAFSGTASKKDNIKSPFKRIEYEYDQSHYNWAIWAINKIGDLKLVVDITETGHRVPITSQSWHEVVDVPFPMVNLMTSSETDNDWGPNADILTSVMKNNFLVLYRGTLSDFAKYKYSTVVVPLQ